MLDSIARWLVHMPNFKGRHHLLFFALRFLDRAQSAYGPIIKTRLDDFTYRASLAGYYGDELKSLILRMPPEGVFLDVGANLGIFSLVASEHLKDGAVVSLEPNPAVYDDLLCNVHLNNATNVCPLNFGIGLHTREVNFGWTPEHTGRGRIVDELVATTKIVIRDSVEVENVLSVARSGYCLCKIDTEGAELETLKALDKIGLIGLIDLLYVEINDENLRLQGASSEALYGFLEERGYVAVSDRRGGSVHYDEIFRVSTSEIGSTRIH